MPRIIEYRGAGKAAVLVFLTVICTPLAVAPGRAHPASGDKVTLPSGCFNMGVPDTGLNPNELYHTAVNIPQLKVCVDSFHIDRYEITQEKFQKVMGYNPSWFKRRECPACPVECVTRDEAEGYCAKTGGRLPTEAEWEYAARAGTHTTYYWGDFPDEAGIYAWYDQRGTHPVGQKKPNAWGLYDMLGNVEEWASDWYDGRDAGQAPVRNPRWPDRNSDGLAILRGGSWESRVRLGVADRHPCDPECDGYNQGFRCVVSAKAESLSSAPAKERVWERDEVAEIKSGCFQMGANYRDESPPHQVCVDGFEMEKHEVTQKRFEDATGTNLSRFKGCPSCPVERVTWDEAQEYCRGLGGRLPTEAEWEYAARAGTTSDFYWGSFDAEGPGDLARGFDSSSTEYAWQFFNADGKTHPVGGKKPNAWGLSDMLGNVAEWTGDWYDGDHKKPRGNQFNNYYKNSPKRNPKGPDHGDQRVSRGGSWLLSDWDDLRVTRRLPANPGIRKGYIGFRCVFPK